MKSYSEIKNEALEHHTAAEIKDRLPARSSRQKLIDIPDDRWLAMMTKRIFQSGFVWRVIESKWDGFETVFLGFDAEKLVLQPDEYYENLVTETRIIRNWQKIATVMENAEFILDMSEQHGGFGRYVAQWPSSNIIELWQVLKKQGSRLGGNTGPYVLRSLGKDTFLLSNDVVKALIMAGVVDKKPTSKRNLVKVQEVFNVWAEESGRPLCEISMMLSLSVG